MRNEDSGQRLQNTPDVAPTRVASKPFENPAKQASPQSAARTAPGPRLDPDSKAALG